MKKLLISALGLFTVLAAAAQEKKEFKITGKPVVTIFANYNAGIGASNGKSGFELERAYIGYDAKVTSNLSAKVVLDLGTSKLAGSDLERIAYVKNAQITWKVNKFSLDFGLIGLQQFSFQEKAWGYRYLAKSFQDQYKFGSSADMGITAKYDFTKWLSADATITNGEGYKKLNVDNRNRYAIGATVTPLKGLSLRAYYDVYTRTHGAKLKDQQTIAAFVGYKHDYFNVGAEYNTQMNTKFKEDKNQSGFSVYATGNLSKKLSLFARYDDLSSTDDWNIKGDGNNIIAGIQYAPIKFLKISPNVQAWNAKEGKSSTYVFLSLEFKL